MARDGEVADEAEVLRWRKKGRGGEGEWWWWEKKVGLAAASWRAGGGDCENGGDTEAKVAVSVVLVVPWKALRRIVPMSGGGVSYLLTTATL